MSNFLQISGVLLAMLGCNAMIMAWIFLFVDAFEESYLKGFIMLLCLPMFCIFFPYPLYYALAEYESRYKMAVLIALFGGLAFTGMGGAILRLGV
ncbi:MAG: hypothetical protein RLY93_19390 [Sumerlaeia bacterium]